MTKSFKIWQQWLEPTQEEMERAIYIDFEGFTDKLPSLIGIQIEGNFQQVVFDESLKLAAKAKGLAVADFKAYIGSLIQQAQTEARLVVAYSEHEQNVIMEHAGIDISARYLDARKLAKLWKNKCLTAAPTGMGLKDFLAFIDYERPPYLGEQKSTKRLAAVASMLATKGSYDALTTTVKAQWTKVLQHNRIDVQGMRALVFQAGDDLSRWNNEDYVLANRISVIKGDITTLEVDAIVNAANCSLMGGGGVDGAIHRAAGPEMPLACLKLKGCAVGEAKLTEGFKLPARYVIHTVGPTYWGENLKKNERGEIQARRLLGMTYMNCMTLAAQNKFRTVAFPSISTGAFRYPMQEATQIAVGRITMMLSVDAH
jgi:O-acetyl-ADP-ribose deacetylase (regulator of RNase III)